MQHISINNNQSIALSEIPELIYSEFMKGNLELLSGKPERHCVNYFGYKTSDSIKLICCIADDVVHQIFVSSAIVDAVSILPSFTAQNHNFEKFEREIHENFGIPYSDHPWLKPLRYPYDRFDKSQVIGNYPFYKVESEELHYL